MSGKTLENADALKSHKSVSWAQGQTPPTVENEDSTGLAVNISETAEITTADDVLRVSISELETPFWSDDVTPEEKRVLERTTDDRHYSGMEDDGDIVHEIGSITSKSNAANFHRSESYLSSKSHCMTKQRPEVERQNSLLGVTVGQDRRITSEDIQSQPELILLRHRLEEDKVRVKECLFIYVIARVSG